MPFKIYFKYSNNEMVLFSELDVQKRNSTLIKTLLYPNENCINPLKKQDLISLLDYVQPIYHEYYTSFKVNTQNVNVDELPLVDFSSDDE